MCLSLPFFSLDVWAKHWATHHHPTLHTLSKFVSVKSLSSTKSGWLLPFWQSSRSRSCCSCCAGDEARWSSTRQLESSCMRMLFPLFNTPGSISTFFFNPNYSWVKRTGFTSWEHLSCCFTVSPVHMTKLGCVFTHGQAGLKLLSSTGRGEFLNAERRQLTI